MSTDERETAAWGSPTVTPQREQAWQIWKDNYVASVLDTWISQGTTRDQALASIQFVAADISAADDLPWMSLGRALSERMGPMLSPNTALEGDAKLTYMNALRTTETSTRHERTLAMAYLLGLTVQRAATIRNASESYQGREAAGEGRTALYRHFDQDGVLLYVGIAKEPDKRGEQHRQHSKWHRFRADTQIEWFDTRDAAATAERAAITNEAPLFNQTHNKANRDAAVAYLFDALDFVGSKPSQSAERQSTA